MLSDKQIRFCNEYLVDYNGSKAAIRAGYSKKAAKEQASRMLTNANIQNYLSAKKEKVLNKLEISRERVMLEIGRLAFSNISQYFDENGNLKSLSDLSPEDVAALSSVEIKEEFDTVDGKKVSSGFARKIKLWDKTKALEMLAKHFQIYSDAPEVNNNLTMPEVRVYNSAPPLAGSEEEVKD
jgi:phage terminase small subunit